MFDEKTSEQFKKDMVTARAYVSMELKKHGIDIDVRLLTTISVMQSVAIKYINGTISGEEAREGFDSALEVYSNTTLPF